MIAEKLSDVQIKYIFIKKFNWLDQLSSEKYAAHPHQGKIYQSVFNPNTKNYKLLIPNTNDFLLFEVLSDKNEVYESEMVDISTDNILDLNLSEEALDQILTWQSSDNKEIKQIYQPPIQQSLIRLGQAMKAQEMEEEASDMARAMEAIHELYHLNSVQFEAVLMLLEYLIEDNVEEPNSGSHLTLHPTKGLGINVSRVYQNIDVYSSDDRRTNENIVNLLDAATGIVVEMERKILNDQLD